MKRYGAVAIDVGTSSCKLGIVSVAGEVLYNRRKFFPTLTGERITASLLFNVVLGELDLALDWSVENGVVLLGICISGNGPTLVSIDKTTRNKDVLFMWNEAEECGIKRATNARQKDKRGECIEKNSHSIFLPRLLAFKTKYAQSYQNAQYLLPLVEYLSFRLTDGVYTLLPEERFAPYYWDRGELEACGFDHSLLAPFVELGFCAGIYRGIKVFLGPPDYVAALIGTATLFAGTACDVAGSSEGINITVETVPSSLAKNLRVMPSPAPRLWTVATLFSDVGTRFARGVKDLNKEYLFRSSNIEDNFLEVMEVISDCYFREVAMSRAKTSMRDIATKSILNGMVVSNERLSSNSFLPTVFSSIYDEVIGILSSLKDAFDLLEETTGFRGSYVLSGGHAKNEAYVKMKAHFTQRSFSLLKHRDAELLGNAAIVFYRCGLYSSLQDAARKVAKSEKTVSCF